MALRFAPKWHWVLLTAALLPLFLSLGWWQWNRGQVRGAQWDEFARADAPPVDAGADSLRQLPRYTRVRLSGTWDHERQFLLENISHAGAPGYMALTVLRLPEGSLMLVNRGWLPFTGYREQLPDVSLPAEAVGVPVQVTGRLASLPVAGLPSGRNAPAADAPWPRVASFPTREQIEESYGAPLVEPLLWLDADAGPGYLRDWQPGGLPPERHIGYAVQWWSFAVLLLALFVIFSLKRKDVVP